MTPEPARPEPPEPPPPDEPLGVGAAGPRLIAAKLALVAGIAEFVIAILLVRGALL